MHYSSILHPCRPALFILAVQAPSQHSEYIRMYPVTPWPSGRRSTRSGCNGSPTCILCNEVIHHWLPVKRIAWQKSRKHALWHSYTLRRRGNKSIHFCTSCRCIKAMQQSRAEPHDGQLGSMWPQQEPPLHLLLRSTCGARCWVHSRRTLTWRSTFVGRWTRRPGWNHRSRHCTCALGEQQP